jgi:retron-type reverse transcriptase
VEKLSSLLGMSVGDLRGVRPEYALFRLPKRSGGTRPIHIPSGPLKALQRRVLRRILARLRAHPAATGFERGHSIVTHALPHVGKDVVVRLDIKDFFGSIRRAMVERFFLAIGWDAQAARLLTDLCTHDGSLPQGAPTSPRLSNLVNWRLDERLSALAQKLGASYSRYADDMTFSLLAQGDATPHTANRIIRLAKSILADEGYAMHAHKKLRVYRRGDRQMVTGLVVNEKVSLPRLKRRWMRAAEHHLRTGRQATVTAQQLQGWKSLAAMVESQRRA